MTKLDEKHWSIKTAIEQAEQADCGSSPRTTRRIEAMTETLKPCPLCHSIDVYMTRKASRLPHSVICRKCGCDAPWISWNTRAPDDVAKIAAWLEKRAYYLEADFPQAQQALIDAADAIRRHRALRLEG